MSEHDPIDLYLDRLAEVLHGPGSEIRRALAESEDHLREAEAAGLRSGMSSEVASTTAIQRFGTVEEVAGRYELLRVLASPAQLAAQALLSLALVGSFVLIGIGLSGVLAAGSAAWFGEQFIAGDLPGVTYTPERCADYLEYYPDAGSCEQAAVAHHFDETVGYRMDAGVLGLLVLFGWWIARRSSKRWAGPSAIPDVFVPLATTVLFAGAAVTLGGLGVIQLASTGGDSGAGSFLTAGAVSLLAVVIFGTWLLRSLRPNPV